MLEKGSNRRTFPVDRHAGVVRVRSKAAAYHSYCAFAPFSVHTLILCVHMQAVTGIIADGRQIVNRAFDEAVQYKKCALLITNQNACLRPCTCRCKCLMRLCGVLRSFYGDSIPGQVLADRVASFVHVFNLYWYAR